VVAGAVVPQAGSVFFRVNNFFDISEITPYGIYAAVLDPTTDSIAESEPNDTWATAQPITGNKIVNASLVAVGAPDMDYYSFNASAGDVIAVTMDEDPDDDLNVIDTIISILDTDGTTVLATNDFSNPGSNAAGAVVIPADGTYYVKVGDGGFGGGDTDYRFVIHGLTEVEYPVGGEVYSVDLVDHGNGIGVFALWIGLAAVLSVGGGVLALRRRRAH